MSTAVVEKREVEPEEIYFHRSLAEGEAMEPTAGTANLPITKNAIDVRNTMIMQTCNGQRRIECECFFSPSTP